jgi:hypothetical protein
VAGVQRAGQFLVGLAILAVVAAVAVPGARGDATPADHDAIVATLHDFFDGGIGSDASRFCDAVAFTDAGAVRQIPDGQCEEAFQAGVVGQTIYPTRLRSVSSVATSGQRALAKVVVHLLGTKKNSTREEMLEFVKTDRWRVLAPCDLIGCDPSLLPPRHRRRTHPKTLDIGRGRYAGVRIGDTRQAALGIAGPLPKQPHDGASMPLGSDFYDDGGPSNWRPPGSGRHAPRDLRYRTMSFLAGTTARPQVYGFIITDRHAQTSKGVGIGDTLAYARKLYPRLQCDIVNQDSEYATFPACRARLGPHRYLGFGQNPIRTIILMTVPFDGAK